MKKLIQHFEFIAIITIAVTMMNSCSKTSSIPTPTPTPTPTKSEFKWTENGGVEITADSAFWTTGSWGTGIRAYKGGNDIFFEINWATANNTSVGVKMLDAANYGFTLIKSSKTYTINTNSTLNVTAFASDSMSGNFNNIAVNSTSGGTTSTITLNAKFEKIKKK